MKYCFSSFHNVFCMILAKLVLTTLTHKARGLWKFGLAMSIFVMPILHFESAVPFKRDSFLYVFIFLYTYFKALVPTRLGSQTNQPNHINFWIASNMYYDVVSY